MNDTEFENALKNVVRVCYGDDNDLIRRGDALNAIREACRIGCLPSSALTRKEQREVVLLDALQAVRTVKKAAVPTVDPESLRPSDRIRHLADILENEYRNRVVTIDAFAYTLRKLADIVAKDEPAH